jgi:5-methylcytosine-specific restriction endonuclease McrA
VKRDWTDAREKCEGEGCCRVCRRPDPEAAHIIPRSQVSFGGEHSDNIVPLCRGCHRGYDQGRLDLLPYLTRSEQAKAVELHGLIGALRRITNTAREAA